MLQPLLITKSLVIQYYHIQMYIRFLHNQKQNIHEIHKMKTQLEWKHFGDQFNLTWFLTISSLFNLQNYQIHVKQWTEVIFQMSKILRKLSGAIFLVDLLRLNFIIFLLEVVEKIKKNVL